MEFAAIVVPFVVAGSGIFFLFPTPVWFSGVVIGAIPVALATVRIRARRRGEGAPVLGLEGMGWTYLVIAAMTLAFGAPALLVAS